MSAPKTGWRRAAVDTLWLILHCFAIFRRWYHAEDDAPSTPGPGPDDGRGELSGKERRQFSVIEAEYGSGVAAEPHRRRP